MHTVCVSRVGAVAGGVLLSRRWAPRAPARASPGLRIRWAGSIHCVDKPQIQQSRRVNGRDLKIFRGHGALNLFSVAVDALDADCEAFNVMIYIFKLQAQGLNKDTAT